MYEAADKAGVVNMVGFNYRRLSAVLFCKELVASGKLGKIYQFSSSFMEDWGNADFGLTWRFKTETAGAGVLADLGSHIIDLARFLVGDFNAVSATRKTFIEERPTGNSTEKSDVDDSTFALLKFDNGALGRVEASWCALGRKVNLEFEINGSEGSVYYNLERPNEVQVFSKRDEKTAQGFRTVLVGPLHPYGTSMVFPAAGTGMGYEESIINEFYDFLSTIEDRSKKLSPTFYDGWKVNQAIEAIMESSEKEKWVHIS
jgi:predicted dehydrogenase